MIRITAVGALIALVMLAAGPASANPTDDVRAAMLKFAGLSSFEATLSGGTIDVVQPDSMHMKGPSGEMIRIGSTMYVKAGPRGWMKMAGMRGVPSQMSDRLRELARSTKFSATDLGMKSIAGESLHAYRVKDSKGSTTNVYIGRDGLPHAADNGNGSDLAHFGKFNSVAPIHAPM